MAVAEDHWAFTSGFTTSTINHLPAFHAIATTPAIDLDAMDLSAVLLQSSTQCYNCKGFGCLAKACLMPDNREYFSGSHPHTTNWHGWLAATGGLSHNANNFGG
jgi:hypothetical protein